MTGFVPIPSWAGLHPLIIHFPIALLLIAPLLILVGSVLPDQAKGRMLLFTALGLMVVGTANIFLAIATGQVAGELAPKSAEIKAVLERHESLAEITRGLFSFLTTIFAAIMITPIIFRKLSSRILTTLLPLVFLILYSVGCVLLVNTAHNGGRLVHEFGVKAAVATSPVSQQEAISRVDEEE